MPLVAIPVGSAMNYAGLQVFGKGAKHFFSPNWVTCAECGRLQPHRNRFCEGCAASMA